MLADLIFRFPASLSIYYGYDFTTVPRCTTCNVASVPLMTYTVTIISGVPNKEMGYGPAFLWIDVMIKKSRASLALRLVLAGSSSEGIKDKYK